MSQARPFLEADGLGKAFGRETVLKSASVRAHSGRITALMGRNGAGKSTIFRICIGRVRSDYGRILIQGEFVPRPSLAGLAHRGLFYSGQESALTSLFSIGDHLAAMESTLGQAPVDAVIDALELGELLARRPKDISGGEKQRASLAMAMVRRPSCLIMDEPFAGVAPADRPIIQRGLRQLRDQGCAVVISGHDVDDLFATADEVTWVVAGTTHHLGSPEDAAAHPQFRREYLGVRRGTPTS